uniref:Low-density lipoprotein receptor-related protein 3-like n=1 Tax=Phallusia mammillata TaxID=59560 RepID=A0A6F9DKL3_9ASCI|nr:low-density lipoprotein receptor-related protein 3-like [Phallusia mammillata]
MYFSRKILFFLVSIVIKEQSALSFPNVQYNYENPVSGTRDGCVSLERHGTIDFKSNTSTVTKCWALHLPAPEYVTLSLTEIHIKQKCYNNYLLIKSDPYYSKEGVYPAVKRMWCGSVQPQTLTMKRDYIEITLYANNGYNGVLPSFKMDYTVEDQCLVQRYIQSYTFVTSVGYPESNIVPDCVWNISLTQESSHIPLQFILNECDFYSGGRIYVYDGTSTDSPLIWNDSCNEITNTGEVLATASGPHMLVRYRNNLSPARGFNATVKAKGYCLPGSYSCGDQNTCYLERQHCDGNRDCATGYDEMGCTSTCSNDLFWCGAESWHCYSANRYCDGKTDCPNNVDENDCTKCAPGAFLCQSERKCIYEQWECDGTPDCSDGSDEIGCSYTASRQVITAAIIGSLICGLLLAVALGCSCKLYTLRSASRHRRSRQVVPTPLGRIARQLLLREAPPSYSMTVDGVDSDSPDSSLRRSSSSRRRRERRNRRRNRHRDPQLRRARPDTSRQQSVTSQDALEPNAQEDRVMPAPPNIPLPPTPPAPPGDEPSTSGATHRTQEPVATSSSADVTAAASASTAASSSQEEQAPPLPKKRRIRPVMVEAPCTDELVEDIPNCVHPNPPAYNDVIDPHPAGLPPPHARDNREDIVMEDETPASRTMINRFLARFSPNRSPRFWRNFFRRGNSSPPFHELEEQPDTVSRDSDSLILSLDTVSMEPTSSSSSQDSVNVEPQMLVAKETMKPSSFYPPVSHIKELEARGSDEDDDREVVKLSHPPRTFSPVEMRSMARGHVEDSLPSPLLVISNFADFEDNRGTPSPATDLQS